MRYQRQTAIIEIITEEVILTQEEILSKLEDRGFHTTQATVSRDVKDLSITKIVIDGTLRYGMIDPPKASNNPLFRESILTITSVEFIIIIKTKPGLAMAVCTALDEMKIEGNAGTLAGDDTCMMIMPSKAQAIHYVKKLKDNLKRI